MRTWLQSQSSSSATIIGSDVFTPWPSSGFLETMVTVPSVPMVTNADSSPAAPLFPSIARARRAGNGTSISSARPPPASSEALSTARRLTIACSGDTAALLFHARGDPDCAPDAVVTGATTDVAGHGRVDLRSAGLRCLTQQRARGHDLPGLTVAALHDVNLHPGLL